VNPQEKALYYEKFSNQLHRLGRIFLTLSYMLMFAAPILFGRLIGGYIDWPVFWRSFLNLSIIFFPISVVEFLVYTPMMGVGGTYVGLLTGNLTGLKLPALMSAREIAKTTAGTPEDEVITTLAIATSALTSIAVIFIGVLLLVPLAPILENPIFAPAFDQVIPALFGALGLKYFLKQPKIGAIVLGSISLLTMAMPALIAQTAILIIPSGLIAMGLGILFAKKGTLKGEE